MVIAKKTLFLLISIKDRRLSSNLPSLTVREMFVYSRKPNNLYGIDGYDVPKKYCDPIKIIKEREYLTQKKGQKLKGKIPSKYYDPKAKETPSPNQYSVIKPWVAKDKRSKSTIAKNKTVSKDTYIDLIFKEAKRIKCPGPGSYEPYKPMFVKKDNKIVQKIKKYSILYNIIIILYK